MLNPTASGQNDSNPYKFRRIWVALDALTMFWTAMLPAMPVASSFRLQRPKNVSIAKRALALYMFQKK